MDDRIETLRSQVRLDPRSRLFFQLGEALRRDEQEEEAVEVLRAGLEHHPRYVAAWVALGRALYSRSSWEDAGAAFGTALGLDPENPVAAAMLGRSAMGRGDWEEAVRSLKLARALGPRSQELESDLAVVEAKLREQGLLIGEGVAESPPPLPEDAAATAAVDLRERVESLSPFAGGMADPLAVTQPFVPAPTTVVMVSPEDPFELEAGADPGAFRADEDVFGLGVESAEEIAPDAGGPWEVEPGAEAFEPPEPPEGHSSHEDVAGQSPAEAEVEDIPLPTITLARLALDQGDHELAQRTLEGVLEHDPDSTEARELLDRMAVAAGSEPAATRDLSSAKIAALQTWLEDIRLSAGTGSS